MSTLRRVAARILPKSMRKRLVTALGLDRDVKQVFSRVYAEGAWGQNGDKFYSGDGSHEPAVVTPYVEAVRKYFATLERPLAVVDIGCGDFNVGAQLLDGVDRYTACDIVPELIARNRLKYPDPRLHFEVLNAIDDPLPPGDLVMVRQVLQHLSNAQISTIVSKLGMYRHWIVTEHLPNTSNFVPNRDKRHGRDIRLDTGSGVILTEAPFSVRPRAERVLCEAPQYGGMVRTVAYSF
jgi:hypothetical protein